MASRKDLLESIKASAFDLTLVVENDPTNIPDSELRRIDEELGAVVDMLKENER